MTSTQQKVIRPVFRTLGRIAPRLAGRIAFRFFSRTPPRRPASTKARRSLEEAAPMMRRADRVMLRISSGMVATHTFAPVTGEAAETVLLIHGWGSRAEHMLPIVDELCGSGRAVVVLDLPGHGASSGHVLNMALAVEAVDAAWRQHGPFGSVIGHSFGGAVAICSAAGLVAHVQARIPQRLVTIAAPNSLVTIFETFADWIGLPRRARPALYGEVQRVTGRPLGEFVGASGLAALSIPTLVVHAHDDKEVPVDNAYGLVGAGAHVEVFWADGYGHRRIVGGRDVRQVVADFVGRSDDVVTAVASTRKLKTAS